MRTRALLVAALLALAGCTDPAQDGGGPAADGGATGTLTVFAAASLIDVFTELGARMEEEHPELDVRISYSGSSALATQLVQGAPADVFASADETQMARLEDAGLVTRAELFAANRLMLAVPADGSAGVTAPDGAGIPSLRDLVTGDPTMAVCAPEVPCGEAAAQVLRAAGLADVPDTYAEDVRSVLSLVELGEVDAGLVYVSDVHAAGDAVLAYAFSESARAVNRYPIAVPSGAPNAEAARAFVDLVLSDAGQAALADAGFQRP
ncbi:molybdate ABC transporter substrate-binding protein [Blastococcus sp. KM273128]|uniref:molybdate ABC transporter substrate-binding protein n=1 Tax=Blastococcus sp. KM273128 TaxID=2570314 RepID=UPI001F010F68|nr:molybdate ABC transporter substrate-binding protein [Blastococcus sp. KM273128]MCF6744410.1 molybdate ABC transporter substrate-binding protein [Blastococcus sp. KM273128]